MFDTIQNLFEDFLEFMAPHKKAVLTGLGILAAVAVISVAAVILVRGSMPIASGGDPEAAFPYSWEAKRNGELSFELDGSAYPGYEWSLEADREDALSVSPGSLKSGKLKLKLIPRAQGVSIITIERSRALTGWGEESPETQGEAPEDAFADVPENSEKLSESSWSENPLPEDMVLRLNLRVTTELREDGKLYASFVDATEEPLTGLHSGSFGDGYDYLWWINDETGELSLRVKGYSEEWYLFGDNEQRADGGESMAGNTVAGRVGPLQTGERELTFYIRGRSAGTMDFHLINLVKEKELILSCISDENGQLGAAEQEITESGILMEAKVLSAKQRTDQKRETTHPYEDPKELSEAEEAALEKELSANAQKEKEEIDRLMKSGLSEAEAWEAYTRAGAESIIADEILSLTESGLTLKAAMFKYYRENPERFEDRLLDLEESGMDRAEALKQLYQELEETIGKYRPAKEPEEAEE